MIIPERLRTSARTNTQARQWAESLPSVCAELSQRWAVRIGEPFAGSHVWLVAPAEGTGVPAVIKIPMPDMIEVGTLAGDLRGQEVAALRLWSGRGATQLLAHDPASGAMLLERCVPGATLDSVEHPEEADQIAAELLHQLHRPVAEVSDAARFARLTHRADILAAGVPDRYANLSERFDARLMDRAVDILLELARPTGNDVLLHGDTHHHNILSATRRSWLAIDPLPMIGDPAYDAVQYLLFRKGDLPYPKSQWQPVIRRFCGLTGVDPERVKAWTFARLISDAVAASEQGANIDELEAAHGDLWTARLIDH